MSRIASHLRRLFRGGVLLTGCWLVGCDHGLEPSPVEAPMVPHTAANPVTSVAPETLSQDLLGDVARVFPDRQETVYGDPDFVDNQDPNLLVRQNGTEVFVTFISGALDSNNALAWFSYPDGEPPESAPPVTLSNLVFADGIRTAAGTRVSLGTFNAGTRIGFMILANGGGNPPNLSAPAYSSLSSLNAGHVLFVSKHHIAEQRRIIGAEDKPMSTAGKDYNDLLFSVRANPPEPPPPPVYGLLDIIEETSTTLTSLPASSGWRTAYSRDLDLQAGDVLRIRGQAMFQAAHSTPMRAQIRVVVNGSQSGVGTVQSSMQNVSTVSNTTPLYADATFTASSPGRYTVALQAAAGSGPGPITVDSGGNGHLVIEHQRRFTSAAAASASSAFLLMSHIRDNAVDSQDLPMSPTFQGLSYGVNAPDRDFEFYRVSLFGQQGDLMRLLSQATGQWNGNVVNGRDYDVLSKAIFKVASDGITGARLSPRSVERFPSHQYSMSHWADAVERLSSTGTHDYEVWVRGNTGVGAIASYSAGHLVAMRFSPFSSNTAGGFVLTDSSTLTVATGQSFPIGDIDHTVAQRQVTVTGKAILRVSGMTHVVHPSGVDRLNCAQRLSIRDSSNVDLRWEMAYKGSTPTTEVTPLRSDVLYTLPSAGTYTVRLQISCNRAGVSSNFSLADNRSMLITDVYTTRL